MIKAPNELQDLRRRLYVKAKAEPSWRFWGLYVHVCKRETLAQAYRLAKENDGAPGIDGVTFEAIEAEGVDGFLEQLRAELAQRTYRPLRESTAFSNSSERSWRNARTDPCGFGRWRYRKAMAESASFPSPPSETGWSRVRSSSSWSRSSRRTSSRGRLAIGRRSRRMTRSNAYRKQS